MATLFWVMTAGGLAIWLGVVALSLYAARWKRIPVSDRAAGRLIVWAGVAFPISVLTVLLAFALWLMPMLRPFAGADNTRVRVEVAGNQFWWHVVYRRAGGSKVVSANEIRLPAGERVEFRLTSADMIHSFWIPVLGGKMDLIPGRTNRLSLLATREGTYRGQCAEFCGTSHALMAFPAVVMAPADFEAWLEARSSASAGINAGGPGKALFLREGCGDCHRIDGTSAQGTKGPDLSHFGSRLTIAAGMLKNEVETVARFIVDPASVKVGGKMPSYAHLTEKDVEAIAIWLKGLQ